MASYDYQYLAHLVRRAQAGSSDAFAELYVATYQQQYAFSYRYLQDEFLAQDAIQETYILALKNITTLCDPLVFVSWLNQINMRVCFAMYQKERKHIQVPFVFKVHPQAHFFASVHAATSYATTFFSHRTNVTLSPARKPHECPKSI